jgi:Kazal-type serine protease inhibitor domain
MVIGHNCSFIPRSNRLRKGNGSNITTCLYTNDILALGIVNRYDDFFVTFSTLFQPPQQKMLANLIIATLAASVYSQSVCAAFFQPVCGMDGKTYGNQCELDNAKTTIMHSGACDSAIFTTRASSVAYATATASTGSGLPSPTSTVTPNAASALNPSLLAMSAILAQMMV